MISIDSHNMIIIYDAKIECLIFHTFGFAESTSARKNK